ncbi:MAG: ATP synthase F1 subunit gamma [Candidatus Omnitrophota bacterium]
MPQPLKQIKNRIRSVESAQKVTHVMEMVSVAKLNQIDKMLYALRPYQAALEGMFHHLMNAQGDQENVFLKARSVKEKVVLCVVTSDNGLCGLYNHNILRLAERFIKEQGPERVKLILIGKKGVNYFKNKNIPILNRYVGLNGRFDSLISDQITAILMNLFSSQQADEVYVAYTFFKTGFVQDAVLEKFLPLEFDHKSDGDYIFEPNQADLEDRLLLKYLITKMRLVFLQAFTSEHATRSLAMRSATSNGEELLNGLVLLRNKIRQANITQDMLEIISSSEALKG